MFRLGLVVLTLSVIAFPAGAQKTIHDPTHIALPTSTSPEAFGTGSYETTGVNAWSFDPVDSATPYTDDFTSWRYFTGPGRPFFLAGVNVPAGVTIDFIGLTYCDSSFNGFDLSLYDITDGGADALVAQIFPPNNTCGTAYNALPVNYQWNSNRQHTLEFILFQGPDFNGALKFRAAEVRYKRKISPAPATATFADVPSPHLFYQFIEALAASGITAGCTAPPNPNYCPDAPLTRGQMAVFLSRALGLHWPD